MNERYWIFTVDELMGVYHLSHADWSMNKVFFSAFPYPSQTVVMESLIDRSDQKTVIHGFDQRAPSREEIRPRIVREILQALLIHDVVAIPLHNVGGLVQVFGPEDTLRLLQSECLEIIGDNGLTPVLEKVTDAQYSVQFLQDGRPDDKDAGSLKRLERHLLALTPDKSRVNSIMLHTDSRRKSLDEKQLLATLQKEIAYDLQNKNLTTTQGITAIDPKVIAPADGFKVLRVLFLNKNLALSFACGATSLLAEGAVKMILNHKLSPAVRQTNRETTDLLDKIMRDKGLPDLSGLYLQRILSIDAFLDLRQNTQGRRFRDWFTNTGYDPALVQQELLSRKVGPGAITKLVRFVVPNAIGFASSLAGLVASAVDSFIVERLVGGWHPNIFLDDVLKTEIDRRISANAASIRRCEIKKRFPTAQRNDRCPCGSGKKFKRCCGFGA